MFLDQNNINNFLPLKAPIDEEIIKSLKFPESVPKFEKNFTFISIFSMNILIGTIKRKTS